tara:strand:+ start:192 stop:461 length:270 start_codon:yes stop_codon:yes gene_type:complete
MNNFFVIVFVKGQSQIFSHSISATLTIYPLNMAITRRSSILIRPLSTDSTTSHNPVKVTNGISHPISNQVLPCFLAEKIAEGVVDKVEP